MRWTQRSGRPRWLWHLAWIVPLLVADVFIFAWLKERGERMAAAGGAAMPAAVQPAESEVPVPSPPVPSPPWAKLRFPTDQDRLLEEGAEGVFQPTSSGNITSALYGSVRTVSSGGGLRSSFHEGIDIAATRRDRRGRPLDDVYAVADGEVAYINKYGGNSTYGIYVVLLHDDPMGRVYTLYAHLGSLADGLRAGRRVRAGEKLGVIGNTTSLGLPMARAHLHFEIGLISNMRFAQWYRGKKLKPNHRNFHGWNFFGVDPLRVLAHHAEDPEFCFSEYLARVPRAFEVVARARTLPDFFKRYPSLWQGRDFEGGAIVLACSENGLPLEGRAATAGEREMLGRRKCIVEEVDEDALGRNGCHLIIRRKGKWELGSNGRNWLEILLF